MASFDIAQKITAQHEGGFVNDPNDLGGKTNFGITEATARKLGFTGKMEDLTYEMARSFYKKAYWDIHGMDNIKSQAIANEVYDTGVNVGVRLAAMILQDALSILLNVEIERDGIIGNVTLGYLNMLSPLQENKLLKMVNCGQWLVYYYNVSGKSVQDIVDIVKKKKDPTQTRFLRGGWIERVSL